MTPLVHVRDAGTTFLESACGSGALALALHLSRRGKERIFDLAQPGGSVLRVRLCTEQDAAAPGTNPWTGPWARRGRPRGAYGARRCLAGGRVPTMKTALREGFTTGSAATGAALAALCLLREGHAPHEVDVPLPPFAPAPADVRPANPSPAGGEGGALTDVPHGWRRLPVAFCGSGPAPELCDPPQPLPAGRAAHAVVIKDGGDDPTPPTARASPSPSSKARTLRKTRRKRARPQAAPISPPTHPY